MFIKRLIYLNILILHLKLKHNRKSGDGKEALLVCRQKGLFGKQ